MFIKNGDLKVGFVEAFVKVRAPKASYEKNRFMLVSMKACLWILGKHPFYMFGLICFEQLNLFIFDSEIGLKSLTPINSWEIT